MSKAIPADYPVQIRNLRDHLELTQVELADCLGVSFASVNRWENAKSKPTRMAWEQIQRAVTYGREALGANRVSSKPSEQVASCGAVDSACAFPVSGKPVDAAHTVKRARHIGIILYNLFKVRHNIFIADLISGIEDFCAEHGFVLHQITFPGTVVDIRENGFLEVISSVPLDGVVIPSPASSSFLVYLKDRGIPFVSTNLVSDSGCVCRVVDRIDSNFKLCDALLKRGSRRIAVFVGDESTLDSYHALYGYRMALEKHGVEFRPELVSGADYNIEKAIEFVDSAVAGGGVDGVMAFDDMMAAEIQKHLSQIGRSDIIVAGRGNIARLRDKVKLTLDNQNYKLAGNVMSVLSDMMDGILPDREKIHYEPQLIERI